MELELKAQQLIENEIKLTREAPLIVGVSGGIDSVVMLRLLVLFGYKCVAAHCNFHLRGEESNRDEDFVRKLAESYHVHFVKIDFDTQNYAKSHKISIEMAARDLRYEWFQKLLAEYNAEAIAVAHHADDNVETVLMNLIRGAGLRGLKGIDARNGKIIRPLLTCTRIEIEQYALKNKLNHIFDSTNSNTHFLRNKIRLELIPKLAEINPGIQQTLYKMIERLQGTWKVYEKTIGDIREEITHTSHNQFFIDIKGLKKQPDIYTVLFDILQPFQFHSDVVGQIVDNLDDKSGLKFHSQDFMLVKDREHLIVTLNESENDFEILIDENTRQINQPLNMTFQKSLYLGDFKITEDENTVEVDFDKLKFPLKLRKWQKGDYFYPIGMKNKKKVSDFLINEKLNLIEKRNTFVLLSGDDIVWIVQRRLDERFKITMNTSKVFIVKVKY